jgi:hypothetical protein
MLAHRTSLHSKNEEQSSRRHIAALVALDVLTQDVVWCCVTEQPKEALQDAAGSRCGLEHAEPTRPDGASFCLHVWVHGAGQVACEEGRQHDAKEHAWHDVLRGHQPLPAGHAIRSEICKGQQMIHTHILSHPKFVEYSGFCLYEWWYVCRFVHYVSLSAHVSMLYAHISMSMQIRHVCVWASGT